MCCGNRFFGLGDTNIVMDMHIIKPQRSQFTLKVAQYEGKVSYHFITQSILRTFLYLHMYLQGITPNGLVPHCTIDLLTLKNVCVYR